MPGKVGVKIKAGRNLPIMDRTNETTDAYVEIKLGTVTHKTDVCRKSLNPLWNTDWFRFELDDAELQDEPLQIRLMDHDTYSANDAIGKVNISLNPLCLDLGKGAVISGWLPVFDTMHGIRGEVFVTVKVDLFSDANKFRQSSCGVQFFHSPCVPHGYRAQVIHGFVEELVVNDDPEYQWIDKIRTPRASNEARQVVFQKLSGQVQRKMGLKAINLGANAVTGFKFCFDLEGDVGVVARGIGTAVSLVRIQEIQPISQDNTLIEDRALKYLKFITTPNHYEQDDSALVYKILGVDDPFITKSPSLILKPKWSPRKSRSDVIPEELTEDETITYLTEKEDQRNMDEKSRRRLRRHMKKLSGAFKSKQTDSLHASWSDLSIPDSTRSSLTEIGNILKFRKLKNHQLINRSVSDGSGMASLLVSSIIHGPSLDSISENESTIKTGSMSDLLSTGKMVEDKKFEALAELNSKFSKLDLSEKSSTNISMLSVASTETTVESDEDEDDEDNIPVIIESETISMVVKSVLASDDEEQNEDILESALECLRKVQDLDEKEEREEIEKKRISESENPIDVSILQEPHRQTSVLHDLKDKFNYIQDHMHLPHLHGPFHHKSDTKVDSHYEHENTAESTPRKEKKKTPLKKFTKKLHLPQHNNDAIKNQKGMLANAMKTIAMEPFQLSDEVQAFENSHRFYDKQHSAPAGLEDPSRSSSDLVPLALPNNSSDDRTTASPAKQPILPTGHARTESLGMKISHTPKVNEGSNNNSLTNKEVNNGVCRRSSDSDLSITPKGNSICVASDRLVQATALMKLNQATILKPTTETLEMLEYPFLTMCKFPQGFILHLGSTVAARSVKLLERVPNPDEPEIRDSWWTELRMEIRSHARALGCNVVLGYSEETTISDDVCVLSATGTAAVINMSYKMESSQSDLTTPGKMVFSLDEKDMFKENKIPENTISKDMSSSYNGPPKLPSFQSISSGCVLSHVPYNPVTVPFSCKLKKCAICKKARVPDVLLATIELPDTLLITGRGCLLQAQVLRAKKDLRSESNAKEISDGLPFLEYELHRLLINKLKAKGMNAIFGLKVQVTVGEKMMALVATGTAVYLSSLPPPSVPKIVAGNSWTDKVRLIELQKCLQETFERNREIYQLKSLDPDCVSNKQQSDTDDSDDELQEMDLNSGSKDTCVLEVDDIEDLEIISLLIESCPPEGFHVVNTQSVPGLQDLEVVRNLQMFSQVWRAKLSVGQNSSNFPKHFQRLLQTIYFKLRCMVPCAICDLQFKLELPESDEIQVLVTGMALGLGEPTKLSKSRRKTMSTTSDSSQSGTNGKKSTEEDLIFSLDEDQNMDGSYNPGSMTNYGAHSLKLRKNSPSRTKFSSMRLSRHLPLRDRYGVDITPLSYVPGGKIDKYLGNLNFFFIRETTSIKEIGGISGFVHGFITELLAIVRAHITALGGNAIVSFYMTELILVDNQHKNQGQCLVSIGGDVVNVSYFPDD
ncbi:C2CD5 family protein [Megaselia abdita]